jgi:hypothetical protein
MAITGLGNPLEVQMYPYGIRGEVLLVLLHAVRDKVELGFLWGGDGVIGRFFGAVETGLVFVVYGPRNDVPRTLRIHHVPVKALVYQFPVHVNVG